MSIKEKKRNRKEYSILNDFIYAKLKNRQNSFMVIEVGIVLTFVGGGGMLGSKSVNTYVKI